MFPGRPDAPACAPLIAPGFKHGLLLQMIGISYLTEQLQGERPMTRLLRRHTNAVAADRVTAVEVFFDIMFVFTLTQLTRIGG